MVAERQVNKMLLQEVAELYGWLEGRLRGSSKADGFCDVCGKCCDFNTFDHRLFITPPELIYLAANLAPEKFKPMNTGQCPYNIEGKCSVYDYRFAGCRIFYCNGDTDFQSSLSETAVNKLKQICTEFNIPYLYTDLASALNNYSAD